MNLVLADTEEFRRVKRKPTKSAASAPGSSNSSVPLVETEEKRTLGLTIVRGAHIISLSVESPPPADPAARLGASAPGGAAAATLAAGPGISKPAGRGLPVGLTVCIPPFF
jgi:small nuclear ribonucleoprotein B and B'